MRLRGIITVFLDKEQEKENMKQHNTMILLYIGTFTHKYDLKGLALIYVMKGNMYSER